MYWLDWRTEGTGIHRGTGRVNLAARRARDRPVERVSPAHARGPAPKRVAVLPFVNVTERPAIDALGRAITQRIFDLLLSFGIMIVVHTGPVSPDSADIHIAEVGRRLEADALLLGQVRQTAGGLCATAELLDAPSGATLWTGRYAGTQWDPELAAFLAYDVAHALGLRLART